MSLVTWDKPHFKLPKGQARMADLDRSKARKSNEEAHKREAKARDGKRCRLPFCPFCAVYKGKLSIQAAHVIEAKGIGGDPLLEVSTAEYLMALCDLSHKQQEAHVIDVRPLSPDLLTNGLCEFYLRVDRYDPETARYTPEYVLWAREQWIGVPDSEAPYYDWKPLRRDREID